MPSSTAIDSRTHHKVIVCVGSKREFVAFPKNISYKIDYYYLTDPKYVKDKQNYRLELSNESKHFLKMINACTIAVLKNNPTDAYLACLIDFLVQTGLEFYDVVTPYLERYLTQLVPMRPKMTRFYRQFIVGSLVRICYVPLFKQYIDFDAENITCRLVLEMKRIIDDICHNIDLTESADLESVDKVQQGYQEIIFGIMSFMTLDDIAKGSINPIDIFLNCKCLVERTNENTNRKQLCKKHWIVLMNRKNQSSVQIVDPNLLVNIAVNKRYEVRKLIGSVSAPFPKGVGSGKMLMIPEFTCDGNKYLYGTNEIGTEIVKIGYFEMVNDRTGRKMLYGRNDDSFTKQSQTLFNKCNKLRIGSFSMDGKNYYDDEYGYCWLYHHRGTISGKFKQLQCVAQSKVLAILSGACNHEDDDKNKIVGAITNKYFWDYKYIDNLNYLIIVFPDGVCCHEIDSIDANYGLEKVPACNRKIFDCDGLLDIDSIVSCKYNKKHDSVALLIEMEGIDRLFFSRGRQLAEINCLYGCPSASKKGSDVGDGKKCIQQVHMDYVFSDDDNYLAVMKRVAIIEDQKEQETLTFILLDYATLQIVKCANFPIEFGLFGIRSLISCLFL